MKIKNNKTMVRYSIISMACLAFAATVTNAQEASNTDSVFGTKPKTEPEQITSKNQPTKAPNSTTTKKKTRLTKEERFKKADKNGDGLVSKQEYMSTPYAKRSAVKSSLIFAQMDKNSDGNLNLEEFKSSPKKVVK